MKIYQVEELVGITKKNIRFYEEEGLLNPERDPQNGYRDYSLKDVRQLEKIKLLRKLAVPIEEIRLIEKGSLSFSESMEQQIDRLKKEQLSAQKMMEFCGKLKEEAVDFSTLNAADYLEQMDRLEKEGSKFMDIENKDIKLKKKSGALIAALVISSITILSFAGIVHVMKIEKNMTLSIIVTSIIFLGFLGGLIIVLIQRFREIERGEEDEAKKY